MTAFTPTLQVHGLTKRYGRLTAVDDLTFAVRPGLVTGFVGPNGAGKSTTLRMVLGLDRPTRGIATIGGHRIAELTQPLRTIGAMLDARAIHPGRTGRAHLTAVARAGGIPSTRVDEVLDQVGIGDAAARRAGEFSLGMKQRLGIATALIGDPGIVILDEPLNGLDPQGVHWVRGLMRALAADGRTVLFSSHLMAEMELTADHVLVIDHGRLLADEPLPSLIVRQAPPHVRVRTRQPETLRAALEAAGLTAAAAGPDALDVADATTDRVGRIAALAEVELAELTAHRATLEDAFLGMTTEQAS